MSRISLADNQIVRKIKPNKVAIYIRWSTDEQEKGNTLKTQLEQSEKYVESQGWRINRDLIYIDDGWSGSNLNRPSMTKLREDVKKGLIDCVIIWKIDRLSRSIVDTVELVLNEWKYTCCVKSVNEPFDTSNSMGMMMVSILAIFAQIERESIKLRTFSGKTKNVEDKGLSAGFKAPYGYITGDRVGTFKVVEEEAKIVKRIFNDYAKGLGRSAITRQLNYDKIPFRKGRLWNDSTIAHILQNTLYTGVLIWGKLQRNDKYQKLDGEKFWDRRANPIVKELSPEVIEPIISKEEFDRVRGIRKSRDVFADRRTSGRALTSPHLLSGLIKCRCGHGMTSRKQRGKDNYAYYMCRGVSTKGEAFCDCAYLRQNEVDDYVVDRLKLRYLQGGKDIQEIAKEQHAKELERLTSSLNSINKKLGELAKQYEQLDEDYLVRKIIKAVKYERLTDKIETETAELEQQRLEIEELLESEKVKSGKVNTEELNALVEALNKWDELQIEQRKQLLFRWVDSIVVYKKKGKENTELTVQIRFATDDPEQESEQLVTYIG